MNAHSAMSSLTVSPAFIGVLSAAQKAFILDADEKWNANITHPLNDEDFARYIKTQAPGMFRRPVESLVPDVAKVRGAAASGGGAPRAVRARRQAPAEPPAPSGPAIVDALSPDALRTVVSKLANANGCTESVRAFCMSSSDTLAACREAGVLQRCKALPSATRRAAVLEAIDAFERTRNGQKELQLVAFVPDWPNEHQTDFTAETYAEPDGRLRILDNDPHRDRFAMMYGSRFIHINLQYETVDAVRHTRVYGGIKYLPRNAMGGLDVGRSVIHERTTTLDDALASVERFNLLYPDRKCCIVSMDRMTAAFQVAMPTPACIAAMDRLEDAFEAFVNAPLGAPLPA